MMTNSFLVRNSQALEPHKRFFETQLEKSQYDGYDVCDVLLGNVVKCLRIYFPVERH